jgi:hypothetical protein
MVVFPCSHNSLPTHMEEGKGGRKLDTNDNPMAEN